MRIRRILVYHFTSGASAKSSIDFWRSPEAKGAEAHAVIDRDGTIYQIRPFNQQCDHAGGKTNPRWIDPDDGKAYSPNLCGIGIELANGGESKSLRDRYSKLPPVKARHKNGGPVMEWEAYTPEQIVAATQLGECLVKRFSLDDIVGHEDLDPTRKNDPGPAFPMASIREFCGFPRDIPKRP